MSVVPVVITNLTRPPDWGPARVASRPDGSACCFAMFQRRIRLNTKSTGWAGFIEVAVDIGMEFEYTEEAEKFKEFVDRPGAEFRLIELQPLGTLRLADETDHYHEIRQPS